MIRRWGPTEEVPLTEEAQDMLGPRWADAPVFVPHPANEIPFGHREDVQVTFWALTDNAFYEECP